MLKQEDIAKTLGVSQGTVSNWLSGLHKPQGLAKKALIETFPDLYKEIITRYEVMRDARGIYRRKRGTRRTL